MSISGLNLQEAKTIQLPPELPPQKSFYRVFAGRQVVVLI